MFHCVSPPVRISYPPSRWASILDKAQGLHLDLRYDRDYVDDNAEAPSPSSLALTLLSAGNPDSFSSLTIGQASTIVSARRVRHISMDPGQGDDSQCGLDGTLDTATKLNLVWEGPLVPDWCIGLPPKSQCVRAQGLGVPWLGQSSDPRGLLKSEKNPRTVCIKCT